MRIHSLCIAIALCGSLAACSDSNEPNPLPEPEIPEQPQPDPEPDPEPEPEPEPEPTTYFTCPTSGLYFCDDFEDGEFASTWDAVIDGYGLPKPGVFDILDQGDAGKSLRFTAGTRGENLNEGELILVKQAAFSGVPADYYVEYRIRPRQNGNTGNKFLYAMGRYQGPLQWYFGGLNMQNSSASTQVEAGLATSGGVDRQVQGKKPIELGTEGGTDGNWYTVRFDMVGSTVTVYLDGEQIGAFTDNSALYQSAGLIGFFTYNRSFELDYVKVGDPAVKPVQLTLDYPEASWSTTAGDPALQVNVTAIQSDGVSEDDFSVASSDETVVSVEVNGNTVSLTPLAQGEATVTFTSGEAPSLQKRIAVSVAEAFDMPSATYGDLSGRVTPMPGNIGVYEDTRLSITFDGAPTLADLGSVRIFRADTDEEVDAIRATGETDTLGYPGQSGARTLNVRPFAIDGNTLTIAPHTNALEAGVEYYVAISEGLVQGVQLNGADFAGLGKDAGWTFTTRATGPAGASVTVDDDGAADFRTVQAALNHVMENTAADEAALITIATGDYREPLFLRNKSNLTIRGAGRELTRIHYENYDGLNPGTSGRALFLVEDGDLLALEDLTIENTHRRTGAGDQAETLYFNSDGRLRVEDAAFISEQDTLLMKGYNWFHNSLIAGNVDFIWGYSHATLFEDSEIRSLGDSKYEAGSQGEGGYILQARTSATAPGFVFLDSTLTQAAGPTGVTIEPGSTYLARSGGSSSYYDNVAFINTAMDSHIAAVGWLPTPTPNPATASAGGGWREYGSTDLAGSPLDLSARCSGDGSCYQLTEAEYLASFCSRAQIFADWNGGEGWDPLPEDTSDDHCPPPAALLPQDDNPVHDRFNRYLSEWDLTASQADIILTHQHDNGGWPKNQAYDSAGSGGTGTGSDASTIDNGATTTELAYMAEMYKRTGDTRYRDSARAAMAFLLEMQYPSGGWPQFYPLRDGYWDHVTFNDNAMSRVLTALYHAEKGSAPFDTDIFTNEDRAQFRTAIDKGVEYILLAQWTQDGVLTAWCAQHGATDYLPKAARAYELESLSGSESVEIIGFLMTQPQTPEIKTAIEAALAWYRSPNTILEDYTYDDSTTEKIVPSAGDRMWYRFYDLDTNQGFFSDRDGGKYYDLMEISEERRNGYSWGGDYGEDILSYAESVGY